MTPILAFDIETVPDVAGISSGGALAVALRVSAAVENAVIVVITCDRGDRYLSTGVFPA